MDKSLLRRRRVLTYAGLGALGVGSAAIATQIGSSKISNPIVPKISTEIVPVSDLPKSNNPDEAIASTKSSNTKSLR